MATDLTATRALRSVLAAGLRDAEASADRDDPALAAYIAETKADLEVLDALIATREAAR